jgi:hypothetical protein
LRHFLDLGLLRVHIGEDSTDRISGMTGPALAIWGSDLNVDAHSVQKFSKNSDAMTEDGRVVMVPKCSPRHCVQIYLTTIHFHQIGLGTYNMCSWGWDEMPLASGHSIKSLRVDSDCSGKNEPSTIGKPKADASSKGWTGRFVRHCTAAIFRFRVDLSVQPQRMAAGGELTFLVCSEGQLAVINSLTHFS